MSALEESHFADAIRKIDEARTGGKSEVTLLMAEWPKHKASVGRLCTRLRALGNDVRMLVDEGSDSESEGGIVVLKVYFK